MNSELNFSQQDNIFDARFARPVTIIGVGSVGSQVAVKLARLGCDDITVWDEDNVASHNIPMSVYRLTRDIMRPKTAALAEIIEEATGVRITGHQRMYTGEPLRGTVVSCVDSMEARMLIWDRVRDNPLVELFVDTRLAAEFISVFAIRPCHPEDVDYYGHYLYPSDQANTPQCGQHGTIYVSSDAANRACAALTGWWQSETIQRHLKRLCGPQQD